MKPISVTRTQLHTLVWSEPRSKLAETLGISDVSIGKLCVREHIPAPPRGYWTKKANGDRTIILPLPMRLPGQRNLVELHRTDIFGRWNAPIELDKETLPPAYEETIEEVVASALKKLEHFRARRDLSSPHRGLGRLLRSEANRAEKLSMKEWTYDKPRYLEPRFQRQLRIFNSIFFILDPILAGCEVCERNIWIQGVGHINYLLASVTVGTSRIQLQILEPENPKNNTELPRSTVTTLRVGDWERKVDFSDTTEAKIEMQLRDIVKKILELIEQRMRSSDHAVYENQMERRAIMLKEIEDKRRKDEEQRLAAIKARRDAIGKEIGNAAKNLRRAKDIRDLVDLMATHPDYLGEGQKNYLIWAAVALAEADALDPMKHSINDVFSVWNSDS